jgi:hypothetical protein
LCSPLPFADNTSRQLAPVPLPPQRPPAIPTLRVRCVGRVRQAQGAAFPYSSSPLCLPCPLQYASRLGTSCPPLDEPHPRNWPFLKAAPTHTFQSHQPCSSFVTDLGKPPKTNGLSTIAEWSRGRGKVVVVDGRTHERPRLPMGRASRPNARPNPKPRRARLVERKGLDCLRLTCGLTLAVGPTSEVARGATCKLGWGAACEMGRRRNGRHTPNNTKTRAYEQAGSLVVVVVGVEKRRGAKEKTGTRR